MEVCQLKSSFRVLGLFVLPQMLYGTSLLPYNLFLIRKLVLKVVAQLTTLKHIWRQSLCHLSPQLSDFIWEKVLLWY